ncbi:protein hairy isoform X2 [Anabrus simplex]|uniref:protein hairy isoform X2 n=1 Tax=Anabrus simplex TaxID=316456 RepID=UPI0035A29BA5
MVTGGASVSPTASGATTGPAAMAPGAPAGCVTTVPSDVTVPQRRASENRRPARHSKLEKADILEMTVKHLETLQRQQVAMTAATDPNVLNKFRAGFSECAGEVGRFPGLESPVRRRLLQHLANCLNGTAGGNNSAAPPPEPPPPTTVPTATTTTTTTTAVQVHILPSTPDGHSVPNALTASPNGIFFTTGGTGPGLQLVPTRLPNGDIALVLPSSGPNTHVFRQTVSATSSSSPSSSPAPSSSSASSSPLPMLIPIPTRTASTASASSTGSSCGTSTSPVAFDRLAVSSPPSTTVAPPPPQPILRDVATSPASYHHHQPSPPSPILHSSGYEVSRPYSPPLQKPLSLVMRKTACPEVASVEEKPWRPW